METSAASATSFRVTFAMVPQYLIKYFTGLVKILQASNRPAQEIDYLAKHS